MIRIGRGEEDEARDNEIKSWVGSGDSNAGDVRE